MYGGLYCTVLYLGNIKIRRWRATCVRPERTEVNRAMYEYCRLVQLGGAKVHPRLLHGECLASACGIAGDLSGAWLIGSID